MGGQNSAKWSALDWRNRPNFTGILCFVLFLDVDTSLYAGRHPSGKVGTL